ncbi:hypothetical protein A9Q84_13300 [Halobacteriovorax marinus]|uniref:Outer membrane protein beta-barrel domain-containing protein n=1 Tax=Halobacteriovorax marinus TaxID=97084 RepID=A0A1Y5F8P4_9BACT|nr:hypothetical protein A9Q84_13300 [Halobacteriovorax marinus]
MDLMKKLIILFFIFTPFFKLLASENLVIVQSVSNTKKTFVIRKGRDAGVSKGQLSLFSTTDISFTARAKEVTRHYSLWVVIDKEANVPFVRDEVVSYTSSLERVWNEVILTKLKEVEVQKEENFLRDITRSYLTARAAWGFAITQSTSEVQAESLESRSGLHIEGTYSTRVNRHLEFGGGIRYDKDSARGVNPERTIPSTRTFLIADVTYHFNQLKDSRSHLYAAIGGGIGQSSTTVGESTKTGNATILPYFRFGYETSPRGSSFALLVELQIESVVAKETFTEGEEQSTSMVNSKVSMGIRF